MIKGCREGQAGASWPDITANPGVSIPDPIGRPGRELFLEARDINDISAEQQQSSSCCPPPYPPPPSAVSLSLLPGLIPSRLLPLPRPPSSRSPQHTASQTPARAAQGFFLNLYTHQWSHPQITPVLQDTHYCLCKCSHPRSEITTQSLLFAHLQNVYLRWGMSNAKKLLYLTMSLSHLIH